MKADGLIPIAFGDKDGWPAMGTFDILNMRLNGYEFHVDLMAGKEKWTDPRVTAVFQKWAELLPYHAEGLPGRTWQDAADTLVQKKAGMYLLGMFVSAQFAATKTGDLDDVDFFPFPTLGTEFDAENALDAPIDAWISRSRRSCRRAGRRQGVPGVLVQGLDPGPDVREPAGPDPDGERRRHQPYSDAPEEGGGDRRKATKITQFLDRDTRSDFAGSNGMQAFLQTFLKNPTQDLAAYQKTIQDFWDSLPPLTKSDYPDAMSGPIASGAPPRPAPDRRGGRPTAPRGASTRS